MTEVFEGMENAKKLNNKTSFDKAWKQLGVNNQDTPDGYIVSDGEEDDEMEEFEFMAKNICTFQDVEEISNMKFIRDKEMDEPSSFIHEGRFFPEYVLGKLKTCFELLYYNTELEDEKNESYIDPKYRRLFEHSALSSFLAYLPLAFWNQVSEECNLYAKNNKVDLGSAGKFTLNDILVFLGILYYMQLVKKGEYENYWGEQVEERLFRCGTISLNSIMSLSRFKKLRQCWTIKFVRPSKNPNDTNDPLERIRPLINTLKTTAPMFTIVGRNLALDETSIACRSKFGRHLIMFNPTKPGGKYHFRLYVICAGNNWLCLNFRVHCAASDETTLATMDQCDMKKFLNDLEGVQALRKNVLQLALPYYNSGRIINMDNYYNSPQLLDALLLKGVYARGTMRKNRKHVPTNIRFSPDDLKHLPRGSTRASTRDDGKMQFASWNDGSEVNIMSTSDSSAMSTVQRSIGNEKRDIPAPSSIKQYNKFMQGVDRLDQLRQRFSITDGHSFKKWYKKLAGGLIDIARVNAYQSRKGVLQHTEQWKHQRDPHREFITQLCHQLLNGHFVSVPDQNVEMLYEVHQHPSQNVRSMLLPAASPRPSPRSSSPASSIFSPTNRCKIFISKEVYPGSQKYKRKKACIICKWENRKATIVTAYCKEHTVALCLKSYPPINPLPPYMCTDTSLSCWDKYHHFYLPNGLYNGTGPRTQKSSDLYRIKKQSI